MQNPLLSIVIVTYQDQTGIRRTLQSLVELMRAASDHAEVIVVDGGSDEILRDEVAGSPYPVVLISEPDSGVYDGMNKGLDRSRGSHVWFLNGGDECAEIRWDELSNRVAEHRGKIILADYLLDTNRLRIKRAARDPSYIWHGLPTSHQAILYPGQEARSARYDLSYRIVGDYEMTARMMKSGVLSVIWHRPLAVFFTGGLSHANARNVAREALQVQRKVLRSGVARVYLSQIRHAVSRNVRAVLSRSESRAEK